MRILVVALALLAGLGAAAGAPGSPLAHPDRVARVTAGDLRHSYRPGCPVPPSQLRAVTTRYRGFDGRTRTGTIVVHAAVAGDVLHVLRRLYRANFPIRRMTPVEAYGGSDDRSMAADNTSGFNCRRVGGSGSWSEHAYGKAIDLNPLENPYVHDGTVEPPAGRAFLDRSRRRKGMITRTSVAVRAFEAVGWHWGGRWTSAKDYQHFSTTGR